MTPVNQNKWVETMFNTMRDFALLLRLTEWTSVLWLGSSRVCSPRNHHFIVGDTPYRYVVSGCNRKHHVHGGLPIHWINVWGKILPKNKFTLVYFEIFSEILPQFIISCICNGILLLWVSTYLISWKIYWKRILTKEWRHGRLYSTIGWIAVTTSESLITALNYSTRITRSK